MNNYQQTLYSNLMNLVSSNEAFYFQDVVLDSSTYRIFNYRLASYTDFLAPSAIECRGIMFEVAGDEAIRLAAHPINKFFNLYENPLTTNIDLSEVVSIANKADGSLISTYIHNGQLRLKSKGALLSQQAIDASNWLDNNPEYQYLLYLYTHDYYTVDLEWVSPSNRIVLGYLEPKLIILSVRDNQNGTYIDLSPPNDLYKYMDTPVELGNTSVFDFINGVPDMLDDIEGFVVKTPSIWFKIKTKKYLSLHHCKDSVNNPRRLWEVIVNEGIDDVRSLFHDDALLIKQIDEMQQKVDHIYNSMVDVVEKFFNTNKGLDRKEYAIKGQSELLPLYFSLAMNLFLGKENDYKAFLIKQYKSFGIVDSQLSE